MAKIESVFQYEGSTYRIKAQKNALRIFVQEDGERALVVDKADDVLFIINADCAQNFGFISSVEEG